MSDIFYRETEELLERYELVSERISELPDYDSTLSDELLDYFEEVCELLENLFFILEDAREGSLADRTLEECQDQHDGIYARLEEGVYENTFLDPAYAVRRLGDALGGMLSSVYSNLVNEAKYAFQGRLDRLTMDAELVVMLYGILCSDEDEADKAAGVKDAIYWFMHDYSEIFIEESLVAMVNPECDFYTNIVEKADLSDNRYLYLDGGFVGPDEIGMADHLRSMDQDTIDAIAATYVEGYRKGFEVCNRDISIKDTVELRYNKGFERVMRSAIKKFNEIGLSCTLRGAVSVANRQFAFDHKDDDAFILDKSMADRRLEVIKHVTEKYASSGKLMGGPAVVQSFGEVPFEPVNKPERAKFDDKQNELNVYFMNKQVQLMNNFVPGEERSFTIIAFPVPSIGENFKEIFNETARINTLDYELYKSIQQNIIDVLDKGYAVRITGRGDNHTDLTVMLHTLSDPAKETNFENCVADVNIPVGEVFTSPVLEGTDGVLHVTQVYLRDLCFRDLELTFKDGKIAEYTCKNFESEEENKKLIYDNILYHHATLPIGEFAIGTNTEAFAMGQKYGIAGRLPILIAEKTGPHFAVGDTCYSHSEDVPMYNPDGKEVIARDNSCSILRKTQPEKAYFGCHTDITIPYYELGDITVLCEDGSELPVIVGGRFVVPGTEELNKALD